ncbi:ABC transporter substrate-binding protein [Cytobacillus firmus]|uniref:ABC transporter substrate-binding protein n=1 Tax=Cytobacillus firmus TaxID=1399 RepID=UPI00077C4CE3|nr:ABC transporter substrate-binding protein [Cytobacillus firmus]MBG9544750.1 ABC transporter substrate-binding protein [Cytobacillus firmus]MBG9546025.1 ABC transporter substrate-binding protein [Cytobacillus firmus]MBG9550887.1 ABC transporter substrate-binding protein [Cytobacillus firmus]MBG9557764.1 ABC transporter substrate-binding protein [Cytobacillus firmus]MBG9577353.1 ABC transporter substrate-binding protein [Cytobacillus firmus]
MKKCIAVISAMLLLSGCAGSGQDAKTGNEDPGSKQELKEVTVVLDWTPNTNHTGLYAAKEKGYFKEEGLDVEIIMPGEAGADQLTASGKADFGVSYQESITEARVQGVPLVSIAAVIQHNTSGFASPAEKNIKSPKDFEGKTYGGWGAPVEKSVIDSLMKKENADADKVSIVNMGDADFFTAVKRDIDFAWIYYGWTGVEAELRGEKINMVYLTDYSEKLDYYTPVLATSEKMIEDEPETVKAFVNAAAKGYEFAIGQPEEAADILLKNAPDLDSELVKKSQEWLSPRYQDDAARWGEQKLEVWENYADWMHENGLLDKELDAGKAFTNDFLPE